MESNNTMSCCFLLPSVSRYVLLLLSKNWLLVIWSPMSCLAQELGIPFTEGLSMDPKSSSIDCLRFHKLSKHHLSVLSDGIAAANAGGNCNGKCMWHPGDKSCNIYFEADNSGAATTSSGSGDSPRQHSAADPICMWIPMCTL